jgi:membrane protein YdbS with pleckstrin-like domain
MKTKRPWAKLWAIALIDLLLIIAIMMIIFMVAFGKNGDWKTFASGAIACVAATYFSDLITKDLFNK